ncbi:hypothetical protein N6L27_03740 [Leisingera sp. SS27]|uniref:hypothetical protein n=1 Tax=Leisingera sp. SS27 TaxID=2979462 RepID=UPI00232AD5CB|nr:hypothetical protein [Leisingera sp. SS27]MDC0657101.1 hypothetical protein [Leisingera sp. SS27]
MKDAISAGVAHVTLLAVLAIGVAMFAVLDDGQALAGQSRGLTHLAGQPER